MEFRVQGLLGRGSGWTNPKPQTLHSKYCQRMAESKGFAGLWGGFGLWGLGFRVEQARPASSLLLGGLGFWGLCGESDGLGFGRAFESFGFRRPPQSRPI